MVTVRRVEGEGSKNLKKLILNLDSHVAKVGFVEGKQYLDGSYIAEVAARHEFGRGVPARPFMRPTMIKEKNGWAKLATLLINDAIKGKRTPSSVLEVLGLKAAGQMRAFIRTVFTPPLAESTIAARVRKMKNKNIVGGLTKPLVETGTMINSLTSEVTRDTRG